ncbi:MAG: ABC transporter permease [Actinomycetes bacterium]
MSTVDGQHPLEATGPEGQPANKHRGVWSRLRDGNAVVVTVLAMVAAVVVGSVLIILGDKPTLEAMRYFFAYPWDTFSRAWDAISSAYVALFEGAIFNPANPSLGPISETLVNATPLILAGLSVALAFRAGLFNIGGQGQIILGAVFAGWAGFRYQLPIGIHVVVALAFGVIGGALWGGLAGWLKARTGAHEVITTIMLNYVAYQLLAFLLGTSGFQRDGSNQAISYNVYPTARLPHLLGDGYRLHFGFVIALLAAAGVWWLLERSTLGFRLRAVGANPNAARTAGMSVERAYTIAMVLAGALAGLAGCSQILGTNSAITQDIDAGIGFDAITVALLGRGKPGGTVLAGILFGALHAGGVQMQSRTGTPIDLVVVLQSLVVMFIAAPPLVRAIFRLRAARDGGVGSELAKGWNG